MKFQLIKAIIVLPGSALVYVPGAILWFVAESGAATATAPAGAAEPRFWFALMLGTSGLALAGTQGLLWFYVAFSISRLMFSLEDVELAVNDGTGEAASAGSGCGVAAGNPRCAAPWWPSTLPGRTSVVPGGTVPCPRR